MGMRAGQGAEASSACAMPGGGWRAIFERAMIRERRRAATAPGCRRAACTPVARAPGDDFRVDRLGGITRFAQPDASGPSRRPPSVAATAGVRMRMRAGGQRQRLRPEKPNFRVPEASLGKGTRIKSKDET